MRRIINLIFLLSYLNILTLIPGSRFALDHPKDVQESVCIGDDRYDSYESIWEILLTDLLDQKDTEYQSEDFPISAHYFTQSNTTNEIQRFAFAPLPLHLFSKETATTSTPKIDFATYSSRHTFAQYHDYLFRLTPF